MATQTTEYTPPQTYNPYPGINEPVQPQDAPQGLDVAKASMQYIVNHDEYLQNPELGVAAIADIHSQGKSWTPEAEDYLATASRDWAAAGNVRHDMSFMAGINPPEPLPNATQAQQEKAVDDWRTGVEPTIQANLGKNWISVKSDVQDELDAKATNAKRTIAWKNAWFSNTPIANHVRDLGARVLNAPFNSAASIIEGTETLGGESKPTANAITNIWDSNPEWDATGPAQVANAVGMGVGIVAAGMAIAPLGAAVGIAAPVTASLFGAGIGALSQYGDTYKKVYKETGSTIIADQAATDAAVSTGVIQGLTDAFVAKGVVAPFYKAFTGKTEQDIVIGAAKILNEDIWGRPITKNLVKEGAIKAAEGFGVGVASMGAMNSANALIERHYDQVPIDWDEAKKQALYGGIGGGLVGGAMGAVIAHGENAKVALIDTKIDEWLKGIKGKSSGSSSSTSPTDAPVPPRLPGTTMPAVIPAGGRVTAPEVVSAALNKKGPLADLHSPEVLVDKLNAGATTDKEVVSDAVKYDVAASFQSLIDAAQKAQTKSPLHIVLDIPFKGISTDLKAICKELGIRYNDVGGTQTRFTLTKLNADSIDTTALAAKIRAAVGALPSDKGIVAEPSPFNKPKKVAPVIPDTTTVMPDFIGDEKGNNVGTKLDPTNVDSDTTVKPSQPKLEVDEKPEVKEINVNGKIIPVEPEPAPVEPKFVWGTQEHREQNLKDIRNIAQQIRQLETPEGLVAMLQRSKERIDEINKNRTKALKADKNIDTTSYDQQVKDLEDLRDELIPRLQAENTWATDAKKRSELLQELVRLQGIQRSYDDVFTAPKVVDDATKAREYGYIKRETTKANSEVPNDSSEAKVHASENDLNIESFASKVKQGAYDEMSESKFTGARYTRGIDPQLQRLINYWLGGLGLDRSFVSTYADIKKKNTILGANEHEKAILRTLLKEGGGKLDESKAGSAHFGYAKDHSVLGSILLLKDGAFTPENVITASHEIGHLLVEHGFASLSDKIQDKVLADFEKFLGPKGELYKQTLQSIGDRMVGARSEKSIFTGEETLREAIKRDPSIKDYLMGDEGFKEFLANQVAKFLNDPNRIPVTEAQTFYQKVATGLKNIWKSITGFKESPTFQKWLEENFSSQEGKKAVRLGANEARRATMERRERVEQIRAARKGGTEGAGEKRNVTLKSTEALRSFNKRLIETNSELTQKQRKTLIKEGKYEVQTRAIKEQVKKGIDEVGVETAYSSYINDDGAIPLSLKGYYGAEINRRMLTQISETSNKATIDKLNNRIGRIWTTLGELGTQSGQFIESIKDAYATHPDSISVNMINSFLSMYAKEGIKAPDNLDVIIKTTVNKNSDVFNELKAKYNDSTMLAGIAMEKMKSEAIAELRKAGRVPSGNSLGFFWNMNTLSGVDTHLIPIIGNAIDTFFRTLTMAASTRSIRGAKYVLSSVGTAITRGKMEVHGALAGKLTPSGIIDTRLSAYGKYPDALVLDRTGMSRAIAKLLGIDNSSLGFIGQAESAIKASVEGLVNFTNAKFLRHVSDLLRAVDVGTARTNKELSLVAHVFETLRGEKFDSETEFLNQAAKYTFNTVDAWNAAMAQAAKEQGSAVYTELKSKAGKNTQMMRALEIIDGQRQLAANMAKKNPGDVYEQSIYDSAVQYGKFRSALGEPRGTLGHIYRIMEKAFNLPSKVGEDNILPIRVAGRSLEYAGKIMSRFMLTTTNVLSNGLDYTPIGIFRGALGMHIGTKLAGRGSKLQFKDLVDSSNKEIINPITHEPYQVPVYTSAAKWSTAERQQRIATGIAGTLAFGALAAKAFAGDDVEGKEKYFDIFGPGPTDPGYKQSWKNAGGVPFSIKIGDTYIRYLETPLALPFAAIGSLRDSVKYNTQFKRSGLAGQALLGSFTLSKLVLDLGITRNLVELVRSANGMGGKLGNLAAFGVKGLVPLSGMSRYVTKLVDPNAIDYNEAQAAYFANLPLLHSYVDSSLNALGEPIPRTPRLGNILLEPDAFWKKLTGQGLHISAPANTVVIGQGEGFAEKSAIKRAMPEREAMMGGRLAAEVLTETEARKILTISGPRIKARINAIVPANRELSPTETVKAQKEIDKIYAEERRKAKIQVLNMHMEAS